MKVYLSDYVRLCEDVYYPVVDFNHPSEILTNNPENKKNFYGFYENSFLKHYHGWKKAYDELPKSNGFYAAYYIKDRVEDEGVIVFRGSDDYYDFLHHDLKIAMGEWPYAYDDAKEFYTTVKERFSPKFLAFAGHSLGGGLAQLVGVEANQTKKAGEPKHPIVCFNAPQMGYLLHDNPKKKLLSNIDEINQRLAKEYLYEDCSLKFRHHDNSAFIQKIKGTIVDLGKAIVCTSRMHHNVGLSASKYISTSKQSINNLRDIYKNISKYKNIKETVSYGQPAFNAAYHLLNIKSQEKILADDNSFVSCIKQNQQKYNYIFNFNSLYDLVHICGKPLGNSISIDIDKEKYIPYWLSTGEKYRFTDYDKYLQSSAYESRVRVELRTAQTLGLAGSEKESLKKVNINFHDLTSMALGGVYGSKTMDKIQSNELLYMVGLQHTLKNLGNVILNDPTFRSLEIGREYSIF